MCCCCPSLHRHQIHLISYGCVSFGLLTTGLVFTVFAIFQKDSQIGKVWLAGPTTMVVGLVLCGKVIIDWGPAMLHAREGSVDSRLMDRVNFPATRAPDVAVQPHGQVHYEPSSKCNGQSKSNPPVYASPRTERSVSPRVSPRVPSQPVQPPHSSQGFPAHGSHSCLIYSQYDSSFNNLNGFSSMNPTIPTTLQNTGSSSSLYSPVHSNELCDCSQYGTIRRNPAPFQGESFVLNDRSYFI